MDKTIQSIQLTVTQWLRFKEFHDDFKKIVDTTFEDIYKKYTTLVTMSSTAGQSTQLQQVIQDCYEKLQKEGMQDFMSHLKSILSEMTMLENQARCQSDVFSSTASARTAQAQPEGRPTLTTGISESNHRGGSPAQVTADQFTHPPPEGGRPHLANSESNGRGGSPAPCSAPQRHLSTEGGHPPPINSEISIRGGGPAPSTALGGSKKCHMCKNDIKGCHETGVVFKIACKQCEFVSICDTGKSFHHAFNVAMTRSKNRQQSTIIGRHALEHDKQKLREPEYNAEIIGQEADKDKRKDIKRQKKEELNLPRKRRRVNTEHLPSTGQAVAQSSSESSHRDSSAASSTSYQQNFGIADRRSSPIENWFSDSDELDD